MGDPAQLVSWLRLLDDESSVVQEALSKEFYVYGPDLMTDLAALRNGPDEAAIAEIQRLIDWERKRVLRQAWQAWLADDDEGADSARLEAVFSMVATFQNGPEYGVTLSTLLDGLAEEFRLRGGTVDEETLARFLFKEKGLEGDRSNYYHPQNSNLVNVIETRRGLPISLACIYMLVGHRFGFDIGGCNWPNHFYARTRQQHVLVLVDCFNGGRTMDRESFLKLQGPSREAAEAIVDKAASVEAIVGRVLGNLARAYQEAAHEEDSQLMLELLQALEGRSGAQRA